MAELQPEETRVNEHASRPGSVLRMERESLGVTVREVADTLNLSMTVVQSLEDDDYRRLPGTVFVRGYIRAYARLLDLDPAPLLERLPGERGDSGVQPGAPRGGSGEWLRRRPGLVLGAAAIVIVAVVAGIVMSLVGGDSPADESVPARTVAQEQEYPGSATNWEWEDEFDAAAASAAGADEAAHVEPGTVPDLAARPLVIEGVVDAAANGARRITETGDQRIGFEFDAECWVEVRSGEERVLYSNVHAAGDSLELVGAGPFRIRIGFAPGVRLTFEGEAVPLGPHTRNNVAALVLGQ
jgi:cytoskeleton protein RodZ